MRCPNCGESDLVRDTRDLPYTYKDRTTSINQVSGEFCPICEEAVLDRESSARASAEMLEFNRQVNASFFDPTFLTRVRDKLGLDQHQASQLFDVGANSFLRYESGRVLPPVALIKLFMLLDQHPELLVELTKQAFLPQEEGIDRSHDATK